MRATTRKKALIAVFLDIAGRIPGVDHTVDVLKRLPIDVKHRARRSALVRKLGIIDGQLRDSRTQIRKFADSVEGLAVQTIRSS